MTDLVSASVFFQFFSMRALFFVQRLILLLVQGVLFGKSDFVPSAGPSIPDDLIELLLQGCLSGQHALCWPQ